MIVLQTCYRALMHIQVSRCYLTGNYWVKSFIFLHFFCLPQFKHIIIKRQILVVLYTVTILPVIIVMLYSYTFIYRLCFFGFPYNSKSQHFVDYWTLYLTVESTWRPIKIFACRYLTLCLGKYYTVQCHHMNGL